MRFNSQHFWILRMKEVSYKLQGEMTVFDHWCYMCLSEEWTMSIAVSVLQESPSSLWLVRPVGMSRTSHTDLPLQDCVTTWWYWMERTKWWSPVCPGHETAAQPACPGSWAAGNWDHSAHLYQVEGMSLSDGQSCDLFFMVPGVPYISRKRLEFFQYYSQHLFSFFSFFHLN